MVGVWWLTHLLDITAVIVVGVVAGSVTASSQHTYGRLHGQMRQQAIVKGQVRHEDEVNAFHNGQENEQVFHTLTSGTQNKDLLEISQQEIDQCEFNDQCQYV